MSESAGIDTILCGDPYRSLWGSLISLIISSRRKILHTRHTQDTHKTRARSSNRGHKKTFQLSRLRPGTRFEHLLLVVRSGNPTDWTDILQLDDLFWLGHVSRAAFDRAVADRFGRSAPDEVKANVTIDSRRKSWLGPHIQWVQFKNLTRSWWNTNVRGVL